MTTKILNAKIGGLEDVSPFPFGGVFRIHVRLHPKFRPSSVTVTSLAQKFKPPTRKGLFMNLGNRFSLPSGFLGIPSKMCCNPCEFFYPKRSLCGSSRTNLKWHVYYVYSFNNMYHVDSRLSIHDKAMGLNPRAFFQVWNPGHDFFKKNKEVSALRVFLGLYKAMV